MRAAGQNMEVTAARRRDPAIVERDAAIVAMLMTGATNRMAAARFGISVSAVAGVWHRARDKAGMPRRNPGPKRAGRENPGRKPGNSPGRPPMTDEEKAEAAAWRDADAHKADAAYDAGRLPHATSFADLQRRHCPFEVTGGDRVEDWRYCAAPAAGDTGPAWCAHHAARVSARSSSSSLDWVNKVA
jgi:DNA-binding CsgD family transcriptional regulator